MEFDFLPKLPKSNLDDRTFKELVDECLLRIPRYCPEWTNYNPSDPGITLIELFAWLTDQTLLRFNQVPRRNYVSFLELLGVRLQAPNPAHTAVTFYLSQSPAVEPIVIPASTEVATERTEAQEAVVFSTDRLLAIGRPRVQHCLAADGEEVVPQIFQDRFTTLWTQQSNGDWSGPDSPVFDQSPRPGNCLYLVFEPGQPLDGAVLALTVCGEEATPTGINPSAPPRRWEAWDGQTWQPVLLRETDDQTQGFSFSELAQQGGNPMQGAEVVLHLPQQWPVTQFVTYRGRWLRCVHIRPDFSQPSYSRSPRITGLSARAIGGTVAASQSEQVENEVLGVSDGTPGQTFQLQGIPVLERWEEERLEVIGPNGSREFWTEVRDFSASAQHDCHYTLDSLTGTVQFGPLIREPMHLKTQTWVRSRTQWAGQNPTSATIAEIDPSQRLEQQYGAVPPRGATIRMTSYRVGGGLRGNVQAGTLTILKTAVPYVTRVINHVPARNGSDAESLEQAVIRVPQMLRTRNRAVTPEDFETLTLQAAHGAVARARCLSAEESAPGVVRLLVVPQAPTTETLSDRGLHPEHLALDGALKQQVLDYLCDRKLLGIQIRLQEPTYVGVTVQTEVALEPEYLEPQLREQTLRLLRTALCQFLHPITGGPDQTGWPFGRPVFSSDIVRVLQAFPGVRYLGTVQLYEIRETQPGHWERIPSPRPVIEPGDQGLICSWASRRHPSHTLTLMPL